MDTRYWLAKHCHLCVSGDTAICLDSRSGRFHSLGAQQANALFGRVQGWPRISTSEQNNHFKSEDVCNDLLKLGLLVHDQHRGKDATPVSTAPPTFSLLEEYEDVDFKITASDIAGFAFGAFRSISMGSFRTRSVDRYQRRRRNNAASKIAIVSNIPQSDIAELRRILSAFELMRPLLWTRKQQRRSEQYVLLQMLLHKGFHAQWILGVSINPLKGHSWIQYGGVVIGETPEVASTFTPIVAA